MKRFVLALVLAAGCSGQLRNSDSEISSADTTPTTPPPSPTTTTTPAPMPTTTPTPAPTLTFAADWSVAQSAPVLSGGKATIHYDVARLPKCRATYHGLPAWGISAYWAVDGGQAFTAPVTTFQNGQVVAVDTTFNVPPGNDLALWFSASDEYGCQQWDSNYAQNFHFTLVADAPALHFRWPGWQNDQSAPLAAGHDFLVDYDIRRLPNCRQDYNGLQTWDVTVQYRFDGGAVQSASLTSAPNDYQRIQAPARIAAPPGASTVDLWFENHDRTGCQMWDSAYGANYRFSIDR